MYVSHRKIKRLIIMKMKMKSNHIDTTYIDLGPDIDKKRHILT